MLPTARRDGLLIQEIGEELVIYDQESHHVHRLNQTAAVIWRHCDGQTPVADLVALLHRELGLLSNEELVRLALDHLEKAGLLKEPLARPAGAARPSRRQLLRKLGRMAAVALLVPTVMTIVAPTPAMAQSGTNGGGTFTCPGFHSSPTVVVGEPDSNRARAQVNAINAADAYCSGICGTSGYTTPAGSTCVLESTAPSGSSTCVQNPTTGAWTCSITVMGCNCQAAAAPRVPCDINPMPANCNPLYWGICRTYCFNHYQAGTPQCATCRTQCVAGC
jgi:hypothetical protein